MATLAALLRCLARSDITEVRLHSDSAAAAATTGGILTALTKAPLSTAQITRIVDGTHIADILPCLSDGVESCIDLDLAAVHYTVRIMRQQQQLQMRFFKVNPTASSAMPTDTAIAPDPGPGPSPGPGPGPGPSPSPSPSFSPGPGPSPSTSPSFSPGALSAAQATLSAILGEARRQHASDVHVIADSPLRIRRHGELLLEGEPLAARDVEVMLHSILTDPQRHDLQTRGYADLALDLGEAGRLRVNVCQQATGLKGCFRLVANKVPTLASLGLPKDLEAVAHFHQGLAIIAGPNGQGKTTTLAAIVDLLNTDSPHHIITVEDPVEIVHCVKRAVLSQREVGTHTKSFARALKASLREDPDVIVIGELRDRETVEIALTAAETGHLVIATMSTRSAAKTIDRLIDLFRPDEQPQVRATLAGALKIIVSQRLVPASGGGMVAVAELITGSVPLWSLIRDNKLFQLGSLMQRGRSLGMIKFDTSLHDLIQTHKITLETAKKYAENLPELERALATTAAGAQGA